MPDLDDFDEAPGARPTGPTIAEQLVRALLRSWWFLLVMAGVGLAVGVVVAAVIPNSYVSTAKILIRHGERETQTIDELDKGSKAGSGAVGIDTMANYVHILSDPGLFLKLAGRVDPERVLTIPDPDAMDGASTSPLVARWHAFQKWCRGLTGFPATRGSQDHDPRLLAAFLMDRTHIENPLRSNILAVSYEANDPVVSQEVTQKILELFIDRQIELYDPNISWLENEAAAANAKVAELEKELHNFKGKCNIFNYEEHQSTLVASVTALQDSLEILRARYNAAEKELAKKVEQLPTVSQTIEKATIRSPIENPAYTGLMAEIRDLRNQLVTESRRDRIARIEEQIQERLARLEKIPSTIDPGPVMQKVPNPEYDRVRTRMKELSEEIDRKHVEMENLEAQLQKRRQDLQFLESCKPDLDEIAQNLDRWRNEAERLNGSLAEAQMSARLSREKESNLLVVQKATLPLSKMHPNRMTIIGGGLAGGLALGALLVLLFTALRNRPREQRGDLEKVLGTPVLVVLEDSPRVPREVQRRISGS